MLLPETFFFQIIYVCVDIIRRDDLGTRVNDRLHRPALERIDSRLDGLVAHIVALLRDIDGQFVTVERFNGLAGAVKTADDGFLVGGAVSVIQNDIAGRERHIVTGGKHNIHTLWIFLHDSLHGSCCAVGLRAAVQHLENRAAGLLHGTAVAVQPCFVRGVAFRADKDNCGRL